MKANENIVQVTLYKEGPMSFLSFSCPFTTDFLWKEKDTEKIRKLRKIPHFRVDGLDGGPLWESDETVNIHFSNEQRK